MVSDPVMQQETLRLEQQALRVRAAELATEQVIYACMHACIADML